MKKKPCPTCGGNDLFISEPMASDGHAPNLLAGLGSFLSYASFTVLVCASCGLMRLFASQEAMSKIGDSKHWQRA